MEQLIGLLVETASKGGNLLLNVGPTAEGLIPEESVTRLAGMGQWMRTHAQAIHGTSGTPFDHTPYLVTRKGRRQWPAARDVLVPAFDAVPRRARMMGQRETLPLRTVDRGTVVRLPEKPSDAICSVVEVEG